MIPGGSINNINFLKLASLLEKLAEEYRKEFNAFTGCNTASLKKLKNSGKSKFGSFKIGNIDVLNPVISAPLAGISDNTFRIFASFFGSALNFTEMISSFGVHYNNRATEGLSYITEFERPCAVQIFGCDPEIMLEAAQRLEERADIIDINMGCPVPKVLKAKSGGFLLTDKKIIEKIITKITPGIKKPLTIKIRLGWDSGSINAPEIVKIAQNCGAAAVTIHGRTVKQGFGGKADYEIIRNIKKAASVPVIVSGDIDTPLKAKQVLEYTGCEAVMIGRAARGKPWIFFNIACSLNIPTTTAPEDLKQPFFHCADSNGNYNSINAAGNMQQLIDSEGILSMFNFEPSTEFKKKFALLYLKFLIEFEKEEGAARQFRKYLAWIFKGVSNIGRVKKEFFMVKNYDDVVKLMHII
jgi:tRNA-dihydrouridine synthase B